MPNPPESDEPPRAAPTPKPPQRRRVWPGPTPVTVELLRRFGAEFKSARLAVGLSQRQVAASVSTVRQTIGKVEIGQLNLTVDVMQRLAAAVDCNLVIELNPRGEPLSTRLIPGVKPPTRPA